MISELGLAVRWIGFPLNPAVPAKGQSIEDYLAGRDVDIPAMLAKMKRVATREGLPFGDRFHVYNSRLAQELGKWAEACGRGDAFHHLAFRAYFADGRNIAQPDVLVDLARAAGLSPKEAEVVIAERRFAAAVDEDWQRAREKNITAVPTFLANGRRLVGAQPYHKLRDLVTGEASNSGGTIL
ncbi:MAG: DsbA family protein [Deltaproteobacteria bacterium]|nr:DsbA family protein [Deltaproteobacteria bacterium]MBW2356992.1 DsbA family protein [Deltaproteobacteria bacterium]